MKALGLIISREYLSRVKTKSFLLTTILVPFFMAVCIFLPSYLMTLNSTDITKVYVIDQTGIYANLLDSIDGVKFEYVADKNFEKKADEVSATLIISDDLAKDAKAATFYSEMQKPPTEIVGYINKSLSQSVKTRNIEAYSQSLNISTESIDELQKIMNAKDAVKVTSIRLGEDGQEKDTLGEIARFIGMGFTFLMFFFIMSYGGMVLQSVIEEKSNRIVEVIVSSVRPFDLMMGKIIGVGLTGITQLLVWFILGGIATIGISLFVGVDLMAAMQSSSMGMGDTQAMMASMGDSAELVELMQTIMTVNWLQVGIAFVLYFIGGYLLYSSIYAMFGSAANDAQEAQQLTMPVMIILMLAFYAGFASASNPEGTMAFWLSLIPFTSPVVMMVRTPFEIPVWELAVSLVVLFLTTFFMVKLAGKIYRTGILMTGKKVSFLEIFKWLNYK